ncbi:hypothetical protein BD626DRAFT_481139 [Schizophyllum amplum]|uniref:C3H1-type domain-containing protein n=1 Tax=Schizophyllum amplum TaxID=97359 RepID=A0A550CTW7_9AGAR|nr:hypothetical protein BD626DRAFT_481139 [Auriculariopsis ampla]
MAEAVPLSSADKFELLIRPLRDEFNKFDQAFTARDEEKSSLRRERDLYKHAYDHAISAGSNTTRRAQEEAEAQRDKALKSLHDVKRELVEMKRAVAINSRCSQPKGQRVIVLLDGDGAIFNDDMIVQGQDGGHEAAWRLLESITSHLEDTVGPAAYTVWVYMFLNKSGLAEILRRAGVVKVKAELESFILGFNQSGKRIMMHDVGSTKEAADTKIKVLLEDEASMPQTVRIYFGGCHDNGYVDTLRSLITAGHKEKLVLLRGYSDMATEIARLGLPDHSVPGLFRGSKIVVPKSLTFHVAAEVKSASVTTVASPSHEASIGMIGASATVTPPPPASPETAFKLLQPAVQDTTWEPEELWQAYDEEAFTVEESWVPVGRERSASSASSAAQTKRLGIQHRKLDPSKPPWKNDPPPCNNFYLLSYCTHAATECKYSHYYDITAEDEEAMRKYLKSVPCAEVRPGEKCAMGKECIYGHFCPKGSTCPYFARGRCNFGGSDMHKTQRKKLK